MDIDLEQIIKLDSLNMLPVFETAGIEFDRETRRSGLLSEIEQGAWFILVERKGCLIAYLEYLSEPDGNGKVLSIQVHPKYKGSFVLRQMLSGAYHKLQYSCPRLIHSSAHEGNAASLSLHKKLGFIETGRKDGRLLFEIEGDELLSHLAVFARQDQGNG